MRFEYVRYLHKLINLKCDLEKRYSKIQYNEETNRDSCLLEINIIQEIIDSLKEKITNYGK